MPGNTCALHLLLIGDPALFSIVGLSLAVSLTATVLAPFIGEFRCHGLKGTRRASSISPIPTTLQ
jgi:ABC-type tungstate transport system substrate-binding protein